MVAIARTFAVAGLLTAAGGLFLVTITSGEAGYRNVLGGSLLRVGLVILGVALVAMVVIHLLERVGRSDD